MTAAVMFFLAGFATDSAWAQNLARERSYCLEANGSSDMSRVIAACSAFLSGGGGTAVDRSVAFNNRGNAYRFGPRDYLQAIEDYDEAIASNPQYAEAFNNRAVAHSGQGNFAQAISDYDRAVQLLPDFWEAVFNRGRAYFRQQEFERAIADYDRTIELNPNFAGAFVARCEARALGTLDLDRSLEACNAALRLRPGDPIGLDSRGFVRLRRGDFADALIDYNAALQRGSQARSLYGRGVARTRLGQVDEAGADIASAIEKDPTIVSTFEGHGLTP